MPPSTRSLPPVINHGGPRTQKITHANRRRPRARRAFQHPRTPPRRTATRNHPRRSTSSLQRRLSHRTQSSTSTAASQSAATERPAKATTYEEAPQRTRPARTTRTFHPRHLHLQEYSADHAPQRMADPGSSAGNTEKRETRHPLATTIYEENGTGARTPHTTPPTSNGEHRPCRNGSHGNTHLREKYRLPTGSKAAEDTTLCVLTETYQKPGHPRNKERNQKRTTRPRTPLRAPRTSSHHCHRGAVLGCVNICPWELDGTTLTQSLQQN